MKKIFLAAILFFLTAAVSACPRSIDAQLATARQALSDARFAEADRKCPELFGEAAKHMRLAEEALTRGDEDRAQTEAQYAQINAVNSVVCRERDVKKLK